MTNDWHSAANWQTGVLPGPADIAHFGATNIANVAITSGERRAANSMPWRVMLLQRSIGITTSGASFRRAACTGILDEVRSFTE